MLSRLFEELSRKYPPLLKQKDYCQITGKAKSTAEQDRLHGRGAPFIRMGRAVRYRLDDVVEWIENHRRYHSTTEADNDDTRRDDGA